MPYEHLSTDQLATWLSDSPDDINLIDIRDRESFNQGHIKNAIHIDNSNVAQYISTTDKTKRLVVCCYHGNSSQGAAQYFFEHGFEHSYSLDGGFEEWRTKPFNNS